MRTRSLARLAAPMSLCVAIGLLAMTTASAADPVYHWKDSNGQSHYSQQPPEKGIKFETITSTGAPATPAAPAASGKSETAAASSKSGPTPPAANGPTQAQSERQKLCDTARKNVDVLANRPLVEMDVNGSGTPQRLTPEQQTQQLDIARKQQAAYCVK